MNPSTDVTFAILVGGRGLRLGGKAKGNLRLGGETLLERLLALRALVAEVVLVGDDGGAYQFPGRRVPDLLPGRGAPGGVASALAAAATPWVLVAPCDMPHVDAAVVGALFARAADGVEAVCLCDDAGRLQPFPGLYRAALASRFRAALPQGPSMGALLAPLAVERVDLGEGARARAVGNVNTPEDLGRWGVIDEGS